MLGLVDTVLLMLGMPHKDNTMLNTPDTTKPAFQILPELVERIDKHQCVTCPNDINDMDFRDELSVKEYGISGMCQECQDSVFGE